MRLTRTEWEDFEKSPPWLDILDKIGEWKLDILGKLAFSTDTIEEVRQLQGSIAALVQMGSIVSWMCPQDIKEEE